MKSNPVPHERWYVGLLITPVFVHGFPARSPLTIPSEIAGLIEKFQQAMKPHYIPTELDGGYPKLLLDHWGFSYQPCKWARSIEDFESVKGLFSEDDVRRFCSFIPEKRQNPPRQNWRRAGR